MLLDDAMTALRPGGCARLSSQPVFETRESPGPGSLLASRSASARRAPRGRVLALSLALLPGLTILADSFHVPADATGLGYTNFRVADVPWSIHVVQVPRSNALYEVHSIHAGKNAVGLDTLSDQVSLLDAALGSPVAAINGDFYQRDRAYAGAPRGLQVVDGELLSGPNNKPCFWVDVTGEAHVGNVGSQFQVVFPDGTTTPFRLNGERPPNGMELYTPAIGRSTRTYGGIELVLERAEGSQWLPLRLGKSYTAVVREVRERGDTPMKPDILVLSLGPGPARRLASIQPGDKLRLYTTTLPTLKGVKTALSGGPVLISNGRRQRLDSDVSESYQFSSMYERHPRAAIGWNDGYFYLVEVDGRQRGLSVGMTIDELSKFMIGLGCQEAMNFDGGGSATLWFDGEVRNNPCERSEREIANCLVVAKRKMQVGSSGASARP